MPRNSNPTKYDDMMGVFKQDGSRRASRAGPANTPAHVADPRLPRSHTPRPPQTTALNVGAFPGIPAQRPAVPPTSGIMPHGWDERLGSPTYSTTNPADSRYPIPTYPGSTISVPSTSASQMPFPSSRQWLVQFFRDGHLTSQFHLPIDRNKVPQAQCPCGTHVRILHLPSIVNWQPPFGVLWNFKKNNQNAWTEGSAPNGFVSATQCPACKSHITLYGPTAAGSV